MEWIDLEVWIVIDETGDYEIAKDQDSADTAFNDNIGGCSARRHVKVTLTCPLPRPVELTVTVPPETTEGQLVVA